MRRAGEAGFHRRLGQTGARGDGRTRVHEPYPNPVAPKARPQFVAEQVQEARLRQSGLGRELARGHRRRGVVANAACGVGNAGIDNALRSWGG